MAQKHVVSSVLRAARALPRYPHLRIVDLSCGRGELIAALRADGCDVTGTRYRADDYEVNDNRRSWPLDDIPMHADVDLNATLPFASASFDAVILSEVVEHLGNWIPAIREAARILKPSGHLILSTPNVGRLHSRLHFFWTGTHKLIRERPGWSVEAESLYAYHISPLDLPLFHTVAHQSGLEITQLNMTRFKIQHCWLLFVYPLAYIATMIELVCSRSGRTNRVGARNLARWMTHPVYMVSEQLLLTAHKLPRNMRP